MYRQFAAVSLYALETGANFIRSGNYKKIIVVGAEKKMSSIIDYTDRATCPIFGDGAAAFMLEPTTEDLGVMDSVLRTDGKGLPFLHVKAGGSVCTLHKACKAFNKITGMEFQAMGELEYYVIAPDTNMFEATDQKGYHESAPYAKFNDFRTQCMVYIAQAGGQIKYGHSEVGNFTLNGMIYEQNEIEFLPVNAEDAADQLMIAKWIIRNLAYKHGYNITFAPKITTGKAGSGLHIHMRIMKDGQNQMLKEGVLSETARKAIAGMMELAPSITAFGNTNPTSYFRLVPHQEAPTNICWGCRSFSRVFTVNCWGGS